MVARLGARTLPRISDETQYWGVRRASWEVMLSVERGHWEPRDRQERQKIRKMLNWDCLSHLMFKRSYEVTTIWWALLFIWLLLCLFLLMKHLFYFGFAFHVGWILAPCRSAKPKVSMPTQCDAGGWGLLGEIPSLKIPCVMLLDSVLPGYVIRTPANILPFKTGTFS